MDQPLTHWLLVSIDYWLKKFVLLQEFFVVFKVFTFFSWTADLMFFFLFFTVHTRTHSHVCVCVCVLVCVCVSLCVHDSPLPPPLSLLPGWMLCNHQREINVRYDWHCFLLWHHFLSFFFFFSVLCLRLLLLLSSFLPPPHASCKNKQKQINTGFVFVWFHLVN